MFSHASRPAGPAHTRINRGTDPAHMVGLSGRLRDPARATAGEQDTLRRALEDMKL